MPPYSLETVTRLDGHTLAVGLSDTRFPIDDADRHVWVLAQMFQGDVCIITDGPVADRYPCLPAVDKKYDPERDQVASDAAYNFIMQEDAGEALFAVDTERELEVVDLWISSDVVWVTVRTDRVYGERGETVTIAFDWQLSSPSEAPATDCVYEERVRDDIRAIALSAVNEARREHILPAMDRDKSRKEAKREAEREVQRIAKKAEDLGCTPALATYVDSLEHRIEHLFERMANSCENA